MVSVCYTCVYASKYMEYCGKGMTMRDSTCSGYMQGSPCEQYGMMPGCDFPLSRYEVREYSPPYKVGKKYYRSRHMYHILNSDPAMDYLVCDIGYTWLRQGLYDGLHLEGSLHWFISMDTLGGTTKVVLGAEGAEALGIRHAVVPKSLWWLDPTLSHEESVPMYALLMAISRKEVPAAWRYREIMLGALLAMGLVCKGEPISVWDASIRAGPSLYPPSPFWSDRVHGDWVRAMDRLHKWVGKV